MKFDARAHSYDEHAVPQRAFAARVADFIQPKQCDRIVELGAGTGALTRHLARFHAELIATDLSPRMVALGRAAVPQAQWSVLDAFHAPILPADLQVSSGLLQWAEPPLLVLRRWRQALAPGGRMVHAFPCEPCLSEWRMLVPEGPLRWRTEADWVQIFTQAGLKVLRQEMWTESMLFPNALAMLRSIHESGATGQVHLGTGRLRQALRAYDHAFRAQGGVQASWTWLAIEAQPLPKLAVLPLRPAKPPVFQVRRAEPPDFPGIAQVFHQAIHQLAQCDYTEAQLRAWSPEVRTAAHWQQRTAELKVLAAIVNGAVAGFIGFSSSGYIDLLFVRPDLARGGIGRALLFEAESELKRLGVSSAWTEGSLTARAFFLAMGYHVIEEQTVSCRGVELRNCRMQKSLKMDAPAAPV